MKKLFVIFLIFIYGQGRSQEKTLPAEARVFVPAGFELLDYATGDLDGDKRPDAVMILKVPGEDTLFEEAYPRPLLLLTRDAGGKLVQVLRNDSIVLCRHCGGVFGDPYSDLTIADQGFSISFYGGSSWRWTSEYRFVYKPTRKNWYLVKETQSSFHAGDPEKTMKEAVIDEIELGEIPLDRFNSAPDFEDSRWKVTSVKTFFYDSPQLGSKPRKAYLLKGNQATGIRQLKNFIEVSFENAKGVITTGYLLRKDLEKVN